MSKTNQIDHTITLFDDERCADRRSALDPIASEAQKQGFNVEWSNNLSDSAEVGIYNEHVTNIESVNADLSCVLFHGIDDEIKSGWHEGWNRFDIGFITGDVAATKWREDSINPRAKPKIGVFPVGWPKADIIETSEFQKSVAEFVESEGISEKANTVLYAPSGDKSDEKQMREFLDATKDIFGTRLIKQHSAVETPIPKQLQSRVEPRDDIIILDPERNIMECLVMSGVLLTEESSVLLEAPLTDTIPVSVVDWPFGNNWESANETNKKLPESAIRVTREELSEKLREIKNNHTEHKQDIREFKQSYFNNIGDASKQTIDIIRSILFSEELPIKSVTPKEPALSTKVYFFFSMNITDRLGKDTKQILKKTGIGKIKRKMDEEMTK